jgi:hypothetical protein
LGFKLKCKTQKYQKHQFPKIANLTTITYSCSKLKMDGLTFKKKEQTQLKNIVQKRPEIYDYRSLLKNNKSGSQYRNTF